MEKHNNPLKNSRILYLAVVAVLCVTAIVIGIVAAANRARPKAPESNLPSEPDSGTQTPGGDEQPPKPSEPEKPTEATPRYLCPLAGVVSKKHVVDDLIYSVSMGDWRTHEGIDIATTVGETVRASADGTVKEIWEDPTMGTCLSIDHGNGVMTYYKNLSDASPAGIAAGKSVKAGDAIGTVGESALAELAEEPHLHFEMTISGEPADPLTHLASDSVSASLTFDAEVVED